MSGGELLSVLINLAVGAYLAIYYPQSVRGRFATDTMPRVFTILIRVAPPAGYTVIALTLLYVGAVVTNLAP